MSEDLSTQHAPLTDLFPRPHTPDEWDRYRLNDEQIEFFHEHGYLAGVRVLDERQVAALRAELTELVDPAHPGNALFYEFHTNESPEPERVLFHALGAWRIARGFHDLLWNPAFTVPASQLLGGAVRFWHDQLFCKPARHGGVVAWHQDYSYWTRTQPMAHLTCWIGLDDSRRDNGCLQYVPGSHRWSLLPKPILAGNMDSLREALTPAQLSEFQPVSIELERGECAFHHPLMLHGSQANSTDRPRRATVVNVFRDGVCSAANEPLLKGVPAIDVGQPMQGQFFPLLHDPSTRSIAS